MTEKLYNALAADRLVRDLPEDATIFDMLTELERMSDKLAEYV